MTAPSAPAVAQVRPYSDPEADGIYFDLYVGGFREGRYLSRAFAQERADKLNAHIQSALSTHYLDPMRKALEALKKTEHPDWLCAGWHEVDDIQGLRFVREDCNCCMGEAEDGLRSALGVK